ncbi:CDP-diacylglycerol--glycerol-3-phosphate 3-phosphatidyltransferase [Bowdeniella nasicola]|uniref:CDP-diacylglycerol--glycerol-3-phosphate 3-phosphatidyltransferase n=1 Tax=Bowdeniella nasicola TaxID=208480 RepID=A0A1Q5Q5S5_9ACTO|nr:CDP-diacylglycerol--glycerol-3-phosphate 3-phosphatidyltransferase [Bowdeniella nasicola]OKL55175.1 CDP-diacylglycerol--glycerol-3-phosphate 3-phosphatidyltransferase [Bowdeniella nasicola]
MGADKPGAVAPAPLLNIANVLTIIRILLVPVFVWLFLRGDTTSQLIATFVFMAAAATDQLDGHLARSRGLITDFGKIADPIADKALVISALLLLSATGLVPWWVTIVIIVRELGITLLRFVMIRRSVMAASRGGKIKTVLQLLFITLMLVPWLGLGLGGVGETMVLIATVVMYAAVAVTVVTGLEYCFSAWRIARSQP